MLRASLLLAFAAALVARETRAQCGAATSECRACHEARGARPVLAGPGVWHRDHAFGDFCAVCHGGDAHARDEATAHASLVAPLAAPRATCATCHDHDVDARRARYAALAGRRAAPSDRDAAAPAVAPSPARRVAWGNAALAGVIAVVGACGGAYVARNERRLREATRARETKGDER